MDKIEQAAILLLGMGEEQATSVLKHLSPKQIQKIGNAMTRISNVSKESLQDVLKSFLKITINETSLGIGTEEYIRNIFVGALGEEKAANLLANLFGDEEEGLDALRWLDAKAIFDLVRNEHPQIIATVLTYLDSEQAAQVLSLFSEEKVVDLLLRMTSSINIKPDALTELGRIVEQQLYLSNKSTKSTSLGGIKPVADVINYFESTLEDSVLEGIKSVDSELAQQIRELMFVFDDIPNLDDRSVQAILKEVSSETLITALKGANESVKEKIFMNMSKRAGELLRDDLEAKGPLKISVVEAAQRELLSIAQRLADSGEISLGKGGEEMV
ncbi:MAG: flagellar motor switch protein FliG [Gammaproteobacteria bacterium]